MENEYFVSRDSVVREIWGNTDVVLFIFAAASAEFALNKSVDWLYYTGKLPGDPLGRLFSTVSYAKRIVFSDRDAAARTISEINSIHTAVVQKRGVSIPDRAYRDVLYMLIDYSVKAFELLERQLRPDEKQDILNTFRELGGMMGIALIPEKYEDWQPDRRSHMENDLEPSALSRDLYKQYRHHLGGFRFVSLLVVQRFLCPQKIWKSLHLAPYLFLKPALDLYRGLRKLGFGEIIRNLIVPQQYRFAVQSIATDIHGQRKEARCPFRSLRSGTYFYQNRA